MDDEILEPERIDGALRERFRVAVEDRMPGYTVSIDDRSSTLHPGAFAIVASKDDQLFELEYPSPPAGEWEIPQLVNTFLAFQQKGR
jgi:hypothetical protein